MAEPDRSSTATAPHAPGVDPHHGNNVAAWSAVAIMLVGVVLMAFGVGAATVWLFVVGAVVVVVGLVTGKILSGMGLGAGQH